MHCQLSNSRYAHTVELSIDACVVFNGAVLIFLLTRDIAGNARFRKLKNKTALQGWTSGKLGADSLGNALSKEDIDCSVVIKESGESHSSFFVFV